MPERINGDPDQFEQVLKEYCEERFGKARPVEVVWTKLVAELEPVEDPETDPEDSLILPGDSARIIPINKPTSKPKWRQRGPFALVAALAVTAIAGLVVVALVLATGQGQPGQKTGVVGSTPSPKAVPTLTPAARSFDLGYPGASRLTMEPSDPWPSGKLEITDTVTITQKMALATADDYNKVVEYYRQLLTKNGYDIYASETTAGLCTEPPCGADSPGITNLASRKGGQQIGLMIFSPKSWFIMSLSTYANLGRQAKDTDTLLMITVTGGGNSAVMGNGGNNTAATVAPPPVTVMGDVEPAVTTAPDVPRTPQSPAVTVANPLETPAPIKLNLFYPGSKPLTINPGDPWLSGTITKSVTQKVALATSAKFTSLVDYYRQILTGVGYTIQDSQPGAGFCEKPPCPAIVNFTAIKGTQQISLIFLSPESWLPLSISTFTHLGDQTQANDSIVIISVAGSGNDTASLIIEPATGDSEPAFNEQVTSTPTAGLNDSDLIYSGAKQLTLKETYNWPKSKLDLSGKTVTKTIVLASGGNLGTLDSFYKNTVFEAGYNIYASNGLMVNCGVAQCVTPITNFAASKGSSYIGIMILDPVSWQAVNPYIYQDLSSQIKATDNLVIITFANGNSTSAPTAPASFGFANLTYPQSNRVIFNDSHEWEIVNPATTGKAISERYLLTSTDNYTKIIGYYQNLLKVNGFTITDAKNIAMGCNRTGGCTNSATEVNALGANNGTQRIEIMAFDPESWNSANEALYMHISGQIKPDETMILITIGY